MRAHYNAMSYARCAIYSEKYDAVVEEWLK